MATNKDPIFLGSISSKNVTIVPGDGTGSKSVFAAGADGGAVVKLSATLTTTAVVVILTLNDGTTSLVIGEVTVAANAGTDGSTAAQNLLDTLAMPGVLQADGSLVLGPNGSLSVAAKVALGAGVLNVMAQGGSYSA